MPWYDLQWKDVEFVLNDEHFENFDTLKKKFLQVTQTTPRLAKPGQQNVIVCDASYYTNSYVLMPENCLQETDAEQKKNNYAPVSFGSQLFGTSQLKKSTYCKEFIALHFALEKISDFVWGAQKPVTNLKDNKSQTSFFQYKSLSLILECHG